MSKDSKKLKIVIEFEEKDVLEVFFLFNSIQEYIKQGKDVPSSMLKKLISLIDGFTLFQQVKENKMKIVNECYDYLKKSGCDFTKEKKMSTKSEIIIETENENKIIAHCRESEIKVRTLSLYDLIEKCFNEILNIETSESFKIEKKGLIKQIFDFVNEYNDLLGKKRLSPYKIHIITGVIAIPFKLIDEKLPTEDLKPDDFNHSLFQKVRNILRKKLPFEPLSSR